MKIFEMRVNGEKEWIASENVLDAIKFYLNLTDMTIDDIDYIDEIPNLVWGEYFVSDENGRPKYSFEVAVKGLAATDIIASTAY